MAGKVILRLVSQPLIVLTVFSHHVLVGARTVVGLDEFGFCLGRPTSFNKIKSADSME